MRITREGKVFEVELVDDGTLDIVIAVNGKEHRFSGDAVEREEDGSITPIEVLRLGNEVIEDMCEEEWEEAEWAMDERPHEVECPGCSKVIRFRCIDGEHLFETAPGVGG
jgi:hypothetical protein